MPIELVVAVVVLDVFGFQILINCKGVSRPLMHLHVLLLQLELLPAFLQLLLALYLSLLHFLEAASESVFAFKIF